jgi:hypothetical protein
LNYIENEYFYIQQLENHEEWGQNIFVIAKTKDSLIKIAELETLLKKSKFECTHGDIIIDLILTGEDYRYISIEYDDYYGRLYIKEDSNNSILENIRDVITNEVYEKDFVTYIESKSCSYMNKYIIQDNK